jgi:hypothetical protein
MPTKAAEFFSSIVRPTADEFLGDTGDRRRGFLAAIVLYHTADYWWLENKRTYTDLPSLHVALIQKCSEFRVIRDVGDASKHGELTHPTKIPRGLSSSEKVKVTEDVSTDALGFFSNAPPAVKFFLDDGTSGPLEGAVRSVLSMWETVLQIK